MRVSSWAAWAKRMARIVFEKGPPFSDGWEAWRPDPAWPVPVLPDDWVVLDG